MSKFKVGDRVKLVKPIGGWATSNVGKIGTITRISPTFVYVDFSDGSHWTNDFGDANHLELITPEQPITKPSGGLNNYWLVTVDKPQRGGPSYQAEADDLIFALNMTFDEGEAFKAIWRSCTARLGYGKPDNTPLYNAQKLVHRANRILQRAEMDEGEDE